VSPLTIGVQIALTSSSGAPCMSFGRRNLRVMGKLNFRETVFRGTIRELLEQGKPEITDSAHCSTHTNGCEGSCVRKTISFQSDALHNINRGAGYICSVGTARRLCPLTMNLSLTFINTGENRAQHRASIDGRTSNCVMRCDDNPQPILTMRFRGVKTSFRDRGLTGAHH